MKYNYPLNKIIKVRSTKYEVGRIEKKLQTSDFRLKRGFTLLETLLALFIVITGFFSIFSLTRSAISVTSSGINRLIAANLAQEGVEIIRNIRDSVYVAGDDWNVITNPGHLDRYDCLTDDKNCRVDIDNNRLLDEDNDAYLRIDAEDRYQYSQGDNSGFKRWLNLTQGGGLCTEIATSTNCIQIEATILWRERGKDMSLEVEDYLYSWY